MGSDQSNQLNMPDESNEESVHDAVGAYLLDALPNDELVEFEAHLATCSDCRREVSQLRPVVRLLPRVLEVEADPMSERPSLDLKEQILAAVRGEVEPLANLIEDTEDVEQVETAAEEPIPFRSVKPRGRIRGGSEPTAPWETVSRLNPSWLAAAVLAIAAVGAVIWALALQGTIDNKDREIDQLRKQNNASAFHLAPAANEQASLSGTLLYSLQDKTGVLLVRNMPSLPTDKVYQLWYIRGSNNPEPGGTFAVDAKGVGLTEVISEVPTYDMVALTEEPVGGSTSPSLPILLTGQLSGAAGAIPGAGIAAVNLAPPDGDSP